MKDLYANHIVLTYDENLLQFVSAESLQQGITILDTRKEEGQVQLVIAGEGGPIQGKEDMLKLTFNTTKVTSPTEGKLNVTKSVLGNLSGDEIVITSYSIHYTKLYDPVPVSVAVSVSIPVAVSVSVTVSVAITRTRGFLVLQREN